MRGDGVWLEPHVEEKTALRRCRQCHVRHMKGQIVTSLCTVGRAQPDAAVVGTRQRPQRHLDGEPDGLSVAGLHVDSGAAAQWVGDRAALPVGYVLGVAHLHGVRRKTMLAPPVLHRESADLGVQAGQPASLTGHRKLCGDPLSTHRCHCQRFVRPGRNGVWRRPVDAHERR